MLRIVHYSRKTLYEYKQSEIICCVAFSVCVGGINTILSLFSCLFEKRSSSWRRVDLGFFYPFLKSRKVSKVKGSCLPLRLTYTKSVV